MIHLQLRLLLVFDSFGMRSLDQDFLSIIRHFFTCVKINAVHVETCLLHAAASDLSKLRVVVVVFVCFFLFWSSMRTLRSTDNYVTTYSHNMAVLKNISSQKRCISCLTGLLSMKQVMWGGWVVRARKTPVLHRIEAPALKCLHSLFDALSSCTFHLNLMWCSLFLKEK